MKVLSGKFIADTKLLWVCSFQIHILCKSRSVPIKLELSGIKAINARKVEFSTKSRTVDSGNWEVELLGQWAISWLPWSCAWRVRSTKWAPGNNKMFSQPTAFKFYVKNIYKYKKAKELICFFLYRLLLWVLWIRQNYFG